MIARSQLAVLDHNDGASVGQAVTAQGSLRFKQSYSKISQNWCVKKIAKKKTRGYINDLLKTTVNMKNTPTNRILPKSDEVPRNIAVAEKPDKYNEILTMRSRFKF